MAEQEARTLVGYKVDQGSVAAAEKANKSVAISMGGVQLATSAISAEVLKLNPQLAALLTVETAVAAKTQTLAQTQTLAASNVSRLTSSLSAQKLPVQDLTALYAALEQQAKQAGVAQEVAAKGGRILPGRDIGGSGISSGFGTVRSLAGAVGLVAGNSQAGSTVAALAGLTSVLGPVGVAVAGVSLLFRALSEETERITTATKARLDVETQLAEQLEEATRRSAIERLNTAQGDLDRATNRRAEIAGEPIGVTADTLLGIFTRGLVGGGDIEAHNQAIAEQDIVITQATAAVEFWTAAIDENATAANDATQAALAQAERALEIDRMTREERDKEAARIERDIFVLGEQAFAAGKTTDAGKQLTAQIDELREQYKDLIAPGDTYADQLEREAAAKELITTQNDNYLKALDTEAKIRQEIIDTIAKIDEIRAERDAKLQEMAEENRDRRIEIETDASERIAQIVQDSADRVAQIMRNAGREQDSARARRDVVAFLESKVRQKDALDDQKRADEKAIAQTQKAMEKQLAVAERGYQKQVDALMKSSDKQIAVQQQGLMQLQVDQQNAQNAINAIALNGSGGLQVIHTNFWTNVNSVAVNWAANTVNTVNSIMNGLVGGGMPGGLPGYQPWGGQGGALRQIANAEARAVLAALYS